LSRDNEERAEKAKAQGKDIKLKDVEDLLLGKVKV